MNAHIERERGARKAHQGGVAAEAPASTASCFGLVCPKRGACERFARVDEPGATTTMVTCHRDGAYPLFEMKYREALARLAVPSDGVDAWPWLAKRWAGEGA